MKIKKKGEIKGGINMVVWFMILVIAVLLLRGGVEANPGPVDEETQVMMTDMMKKTMEEFTKKMEEIVDRRLELTDKKIDERHEEWKEMRSEMNGVKNQLMEMKKDLTRIDMMDRELRRKNIVIFGMDVRHAESKYDTCFRVMELLANYMDLRIDEEGIDNCYWLGKRVGKRPLLVKFARGAIRDEVLNRTRYLKGSKIWIEQDYDYVTIQTRRELIPYMREARKNGKRAMLKGNKLRIGDRIYDVEYCRNNLKKEETRDRERRRSWSMGHNGERRTSQERRGENRNRSVSPGIDTWRQREHQPERVTQRRNVVVTHAETMEGACQQDVTARGDELERTEDVWRKGKQKEFVRQSKSPVLGNAQRQIGGGNEWGGYYFRSGANRRK